MDDLGVGSEAIQAAGDTVVESGAKGDEQVGLLHGGDRRVVAMHPRHAEAEVVTVRECPPGHERRDHADPGQLGQLPQGIGSACLQDATTHVEHRSFGGPDELRRGPDGLRVDLGLRVVAGQVDGDVIGPGHGRPRIARIHDVLRDVHEDRTRATGGRYVERLLDGPRDVLGLGDEEVVLGDRLGDAGRVALLEGIGADGAGRDLSGDDDHRDRVHVGVAERGDDVRGRRTGRDHGDARATGGVCIALRHVAGTLFVAHQDVPDRRVDDRVVDGQDRPARQPEHDLDTLVLEGTDEGSTAVHLFCCHWALTFGGSGRKAKRPPATGGRGTQPSGGGRVPTAVLLPQGRRCS